MYICLAETVIVGLVPGAYTWVSDGTDPLVGMIQDYGASGPRPEKKGLPVRLPAGRVTCWLLNRRILSITEVVTIMVK